MYSQFWEKKQIDGARWKLQNLSFKFLNKLILWQ